MRHALKGVLLLSGGFDSPVAAKMVQTQGVQLVALHASFEPLTDDRSVEKAKELAKHLGIEDLRIVKLGETLATIPQDRDAHRYYFVLQKRMFYRLAEALADEVGADFIVTGENLGQVSSQTLSNLSSIEMVAKRPIVRPLLGLDKVEIIDRAKAMGTYDISVGPELCDILGPDKPATVSDAGALQEIEERLGLIEGLPAATTA